MQPGAHAARLQAELPRPGRDEFNREHASIDFDVVTELVFRDRAAFLEWIKKLSVDAIGEDEARFLDRSRTRAYVVDEHATA